MGQPRELFGLEKACLENEVAAQFFQKVGQVDAKAPEEQQELTIDKGSMLYSIQGKAFQRLEA